MMKCELTQCWMGLARTAIAVLVASLWLGGVAEGVVVIDHNGTTDPLSENWLLNDGARSGGGGPSITKGPIDGQAWQISSASVPGDVATYQRNFYYITPTVAEMDQYLTDGWSYTVDMQIPGSEARAMNGHMDLGMFTGGSSIGNGVRWGMGWERDAAGNVTVRVRDDTGTSMVGGSQTDIYAVPGGGGYHTYQMVQAAGNPQKVDIYVDGVLAMSNNGGRTHNVTRINWGDNADEAPGESWWRTVSLESPAGAIIPEPSTLWLLASGMLGWLALGRRRRE